MAQVIALFAGFWLRYPVLSPEELGRWTREEFIRLGPAFIKLGQMLSTRPIPPIPAGFYEQLRSLQDQVPSEPLLQHAFEDLVVESQAFRAASVAQVHLAVYKEDQRAVLKLRKASVGDAISIDLDLLAQLPLGSDWRQTIQTLREAFVQELDFEREFRCLQVAQRVSALTVLEPLPQTPVPLAVRSEGVVMSYLPGTSIYKVTASAETAQAILDSFLSYVRIAGCFHSDPHPGNVAIGDDGEIIWYDLSALLPLPKDFPELLKNSTIPLATGDVGRLYEVLVAYGALEPLPGSRSAFLEFWELVQDSQASLSQLEGIARKLVFSPVYLTLGRSLYSLQGVCMTVNPVFRLEEGLRSHLERNFPNIDVVREVEAAALRVDRALQRIDYVQRLVESAGGLTPGQQFVQNSLLAWTTALSLYSFSLLL